MPDCNDSDDAPEGSIDDLREDLAAVAEDLRAEAEANRTDRADGEPVSAKEGQAVPTTPPKQDPFNPQPVLLLTHAAGNEQRPLPRRSRQQGPLVPPVRSDSVTIDAEVIESGGTYTVECTVRNVGGLPARKVDVELYVEHYEPDARVDTSGGAVELARDYLLRGDHPDYRVSGVTTMAPDSKVSAFAHMDDSGPPFDKVLGYAADMSVSDGRTFTGYVGGKPDEFLDGDPVPQDRDGFTLEVWETSLAPPGTVGPTKGGRPSFFEDPDHWGGIRLASVPGRYADDPSSALDRRDQFLAGSVGDRGTRRVGKQSTSIPGSNAASVSFTYSPRAGDVPEPRDDIEQVEGDYPGIREDDGPGLGRAVTAFYARAYSLATSEMPDDWSSLDHTTSRFVGRTEVPRRS